MFCLSCGGRRARSFDSERGIGEGTRGIAVGPSREGVVWWDRVESPDGSPVGFVVGIGDHLGWIWGRLGGMDREDLWGHLLVMWGGGVVQEAPHNVGSTGSCRGPLGAWRNSVGLVVVW